MSMRLFTLVSFLSCAALSCGGSSSSSSIPRADACAQASQAACAKVFSCATSDPVVALIQASLGNSEAACNTMIQTKYCGVLECATADQYHGDKAAQCKQQFTDATCPALSMAGLAAATGGVPAFLAAFPQCGQICAGADAGSGG